VCAGNRHKCVDNRQNKPNPILKQKRLKKLVQLFFENIRKLEILELRWKCNSKKCKKFMV